MTTSANVIEYTIKDKMGETKGHFRKHIMCKLPDFADLLTYQPLADHNIIPWGYDEEEDEWEGEEQNLRTFLFKMKSYNKLIKEYFEKEDKS